MLALLIGAGFSKWAMDVPIISELFDFAVSVTKPRDIHRINLLRKFKGEWDRSHPNDNERFIEACLMGGIQIRKRVIWYITRRLSEPFLSTMLGGIQSFMIDDSRRFRIAGMNKARTFFNTMLTHPVAGIITPNYDLMVEYSLGTNNFNYGVVGEGLFGRGKNPWFPWQGLPVNLTGTLPVAKIHGSLSWDSEYRYTDGRAGVRGHALIIPPSHEKKPPAILSDIWTLASQILSSAIHILIFGFAFNPHDEAILSLLTDNNNNVKKVLIVDPSPKIQTAQQIWPNASILSAPPSDSPLIMKQWIYNLFKSNT